MKTLRSPRGTCVAAFLLGGLLALLIVAPARADESGATGPLTEAVQAAAAVAN
ncbi:MAG TPA: hypothetical protein VHO24_02035 [Opitutaceae bacterium]|nr:hypothetical protein [Opitutaceae bacterium]